MPTTIAFIGATAGCGLAALRLAVAAGHHCIVLARTPSKMDAVFPSKPANLTIVQGDAHDAASVSSILIHPEDPTRFVDAVHFSIGGTLNLKNMTIPDPEICRKGMATLLSSLKTLRGDKSVQGRPALFIISTTGISKFGRDVPWAFIPMYKFMLKMPHEDKEVMEKLVIESGERWTMVRPSFLTDGEQTQTKIRVGVEDPQKGVEKKAIGYTISRADVGQWMFKNLYEKMDSNEYEGKAVSISY